MFYVDGTGLHGLVCAVVDQSSTTQWGCYATNVVGASGTSIGTGAQNTIDIVNSFCGGAAATICSNLNLNK